MITVDDLFVFLSTDPLSISTRVHGKKRIIHMITIN